MYCPYKEPVREVWEVWLHLQVYFLVRCEAGTSCPTPLHTGVRIDLEALGPYAPVHGRQRLPVDRGLQQELRDLF